MEEKVEMYQVRTIGERFSATSDFVRGNWRVLANNLLPAGLLLALLTGFFMQYYMQDLFVMMENPVAVPVINWWAYTGMMLTSMAFSLFVYGTTGAILNKYAQGLLMPDTRWADLKEDFFPIVGKILIQSCIVALAVLAAAGITGLIVWLIPHNSAIMTGVLTTLFMVILLALLILFIPALSLIYYPLYFEQASAWKGITKGFQWGFKYWGSTFLTAFLGALILVVCVYIMAMPYVLYTAFNMGSGGWMGYLFSVLMFVAVLFLQPLYAIFMGFQYTSIASRLSNAN